MTGVQTCALPISSSKSKTAKIIGIEHDLEVGLKANLAVFDLEEEYVITKESIKSKSINTPFLETKCFGALKYHVLDGKVTKI